MRKDGWNLQDEQYLMVVENRLLWVDLLVTNVQRTILIEIKSFLSSSQVEDMANAIGKYSIYSAILDDKNSDFDLYLAIPQFAYEGIFSERLGEIVVNYSRLSIIVYEPDTEIITEWIR